MIYILKDILENSSDEFIQIKVLETLSLLLNPEIFSITQAIVDNIISICFKCIGHKNLNIKNTVSAILQQLTSISFYFLSKINSAIGVDEISAITSRKVDIKEKSSSQMPLTSRSSPSSKIDNSKNNSTAINLNNNDVFKVCQSLFKEFILLSDGMGKIQNTIYTRALGNSVII